MSKPPPILDYATPERWGEQIPIHAAVILYVWAVFGALGGAFLCLAGFAMIRIEIGYTSTSSPIWYLLFVQGVLLVVWGIVTFSLAIQMQRNRWEALRWAANLMLFAWILVGVICITLIMGGAELGRPGEWMGVALFFTAIFVPIAVMMGVTWMLLRRAIPS